MKVRWVRSSDASAVPLAAGAVSVMGSLLSTRVLADKIAAPSLARDIVDVRVRSGGDKLRRPTDALAVFDDLIAFSDVRCRELVAELDRLDGRDAALRAVRGGDAQHFPLGQLADGDRDVVFRVHDQRARLTGDTVLRIGHRHSPHRLCDRPSEIARCGTLDERYGLVPAVSSRTGEFGTRKTREPAGVSGFRRLIAEWRGD